MIISHHQLSEIGLQTALQAIVARSRLLYCVTALRLSSRRRPNSSPPSNLAQSAA
jgi:hypothetical protein